MGAGNLPLHRVRELEQFFHDYKQLEAKSVEVSRACAAAVGPSS